MANTTVSNTLATTANNSLNVLKGVDRAMNIYVARENVFASVIGPEAEKPIRVLRELGAQKGDALKFWNFAKLQGAGITGDSTMSGNEEAMVPYSDNVRIDQIRNGIRLDGKITEQRSEVNLIQERAPQLATWGLDWFNETITVYLSGARGVRPGGSGSGGILPTGYTGFASNALNAPDAGHTSWGTTATSAATLTAGEKMSTAALDRAMAKLKRLANAFTPMKPMGMRNGVPMWPCYITTEQWFDLQQDPAFMNAQLQAADRGDNNPLFTGRLGFWKNLVLFENPYGVLFNTYGAAGNLPAARAVILGQGAAALGVGAFAPQTVPAATPVAVMGNGGNEDAGVLAGMFQTVMEAFDYGNQEGMVVRAIVGVKKIQMNSADLGTFSVDTAYTAA